MIYSKPKDAKCLDSLPLRVMFILSLRQTAMESLLGLCVMKTINTIYLKKESSLGWNNLRPKVSSKEKALALITLCHNNHQAWRRIL